MHGRPAVPTQAERKTKKNKSIRDALPREGEKNITDAFLQQRSRPLRMQRTGRFVFMEKGRGTNYFILLLAFMRCSWLRICLRMRRFSGVTSSSSS